MAFATGTDFDRYEIISLLGSGGMGEVYLARDKRLERKVALKLLRPDFTNDPSRLSRFEQEAKAASALNHPNIITIHEINEFEAKSFITTEFIDGRTMRQIIALGKLPIFSALDIAIQVASALAAAHEAGIVHRDIKPENIMMRHDGIVKVLDFGLAKLTESQIASTDPQADGFSRLDTEPGTVLGTATYMSPEQTRGLKVDARTDVFSLGVVIYELVTGAPPFSGKTAADVMTEVLNREQMPLSHSVPAVPVELQRIVSKALRKDREERYQTVKDLLLDLKSLRRELEISNTLNHPVNSGAGSNAKAVGYETQPIDQTAPLEVPSTDRQVIQTTSSAEYIVTQIKQHKRGILLTLAALILILAAALAFTKRNHTIDSIAVLPFNSQGSDDEARMLSDAITDSIINSLSQLSNLSVRPRSAVQRFAGNEDDTNAREVGKTLDVHTVLRGRVSQRGDELTVSVALEDARKDVHLWGNKYTGKIADLLLLQQDIARDVSEKLRLKLSDDQKRRQEAYQLYLKGRNAWRRRTSQDIQEGIGYFERAIKEDPSYAPAHAGLADCYNMLAYYSILHGRDAYPKARDAAMKALSLDQGLAEAHAALAFIHYQWEWNWQEADREFRRAIDLDPNYAPAHQWYSSFLAAMGRTDEAVEEGNRAAELEPFSISVSMHPGWINYLMRRYDAAIKLSQQNTKLYPNSFFVLRYQALAYEAQGKHEEAINLLERALSNTPGSILLRTDLGHAYAVAGRRKEALASLEELRQLSGQRHVSSFHLGLIYAGLGDKDRAFEMLNKAYTERAERLVWINVDPRFDKLRTDPRFINLLQRLRLGF
jgi:eukaryotic-like serine/threonine-protein kinase